MKFNFNEQKKSYSFWLSLASAIFLLVQAIGKPLGLNINEEIYMSIINAVLGIFVVLGILTYSNTTQDNENQNIKSEEEMENINISETENIINSENTIVNNSAEQNAEINLYNEINQNSEENIKVENEINSNFTNENINLENNDNITDINQNAEIDTENLTTEIKEFNDKQQSQLNTNSECLTETVINQNLLENTNSNEYSVSINNDKNQNYITETIVNSNEEDSSIFEGNSSVNFDKQAEICQQNDVFVDKNNELNNIEKAQINFE